MLKRPILFFSPGFMLMEYLFAFAIGAILCICINKSYPYVIQMLTQAYQQYRLDIFLRGRLIVLETQLRRAGYCNGKCQPISPIKLIEKSHHSYLTCVIFIYDMNSNGRWEPISSKESEYFGFRLKNGQLEHVRGVDDCQSSGWQKFFDSNEIHVTEFIIKSYSERHPIKQTPFFYLSLSLKLELKQNPAVKSHYEARIALRNISYL
ncbi:prepilin peptidase-dependent protein [Proteus myxofaciens]|uniref:Prepilin peptidase-dependent protein B n=1 Tax=Proteus myxofaciens ATCC 19692 TaxID=1354337 RepID=A0A198GDQ6_9GAMM|nr:prepilin peptidase-dependent protein [Proteus myxofaciens]OAT34356.1 prepilin peptidase-dependent protein B [Proteus myxofaciens ATCC 19692]